MDGLLNKTFFRFLFGFMVIVGISLFASGFVSYLMDRDEPHTADTFESVFAGEEANAE